MCFILQVGLDGELKAALSKLDLKLQAMEQRDLSISTDFGKITHVQTDLFEVLHSHRIRVRRICMHMEESGVISVIGSVFVSYFVPYSISSPSPLHPPLPPSLPTSLPLHVMINRSTWITPSFERPARMATPYSLYPHSTRLNDATLQCLSQRGSMLLLLFQHKPQHPVYHCLEQLREEVWMILRALRKVWSFVHVHVHV